MSGPGEEPDVAAAREAVIEAAARSAKVYGLSGSYGRLYAILFFAEEPLSLDALAERSGYAKSTVSTAMQTMERLHLVHRRSIPGEGKRLFFESESDFWHILQQVLNQEVRREIRMMTQALESAETTLEGSDNPRSDEDLEKVRFLKGQYEEWEMILNVLTNTSMEEFTGLVASLQDEH